MRKVVKISASWCGPCKVLKPIFEKVKEELESEELIFESVDDQDEDKFEELSGKFGIRTVPTTLILNENDEIIDKIIGTSNEETYRDFILKNI